MLEERKKLCPAMDLRKRMEERGLAWAMEAEEGDEKKEETPPPPRMERRCCPSKEEAYCSRPYIYSQKDKDIFF